jgi:plastocyanin
MEETTNEENSGSKTGLIVGVIVLLVVAAGGYYAWSTQMAPKSAAPVAVEDEQEEAEMETMEEEMDTTAMVASPGAMATESATAMMEAGSQTITVEGGNFYFKPNEIKVKMGTPVKLTFSNSQGFHDFVIDDLDIKTQQITAGNNEVVEFTPTKKGKYEFYCSVGQHKQMGMKGTLIVE